MAVKHLHNLGHKKIAFINGSLFSLVSDQRQEAFENSMRNAGLEIYRSSWDTATIFLKPHSITFQILLQQVPPLSSAEATL